MKAKTYFHLAPHNWNCAQAIHKSQQAHTGLSDEEIELHFRPMGGGRAPEGVCGALYAIQTLVDEDRQQALSEEFRHRTGGTTCRELKGRCGRSCLELVGIAEEILEQELTNSKQ